MALPVDKWGLINEKNGDVVLGMFSGVSKIKFEFMARIRYRGTNGQNRRFQYKLHAK